MIRLPQQLYRAEQVSALDRTAIDQFHVPGIDLMQRAGAACFQALRQRMPRARRMAVFCGSGNNGGDGFIIARLAYEAGLQVRVYLLAEEARLKGDAKLAYQQLLATPVAMVPAPESFEEDADIIVDALLGTGLSGEVQGRYRSAIEWINQQKECGHCHVVAVDIPSGLHADTGRVLGVAVKADMTVTFIGVKQGLLTGQGPDYVGELVFDDLSVPPQVYEQVACSTLRIDEALLPAFFKPRQRSSHKGDYGHVLVLGGNYGMAGAARMAGEAALRSGAGLVSVACRPEHVTAIVAGRPELMCHAITSVTQLKKLTDVASCVVAGPGLGRDDWAKSLLGAVLDTRKPLVLDADALNLVALNPERHDNWVLTPHPGEAARLLGISNREVQNDRFAAATALQTRYGGVAVLKGKGTLVCDTQGRLYLCDAGNPGMASGGMGDVLSGVLGACIAQFHNLDQSAQAAVVAHARAGDLAAAEAGERGLLASDLFGYLRQLVNP